MIGFQSMKHYFASVSNSVVSQLLCLKCAAQNFKIRSHLILNEEIDKKAIVCIEHQLRTATKMTILFRAAHAVSAFQYSKEKQIRHAFHKMHEMNKPNGCMRKFFLLSKLTGIGEFYIILKRKNVLANKTKFPSFSKMGKLQISVYFFYL